jgi:hypothetical protein
MAERSLIDENPFDKNFAKWNKNFKGITPDDVKKYKPASQGTQFIQSLSHPEIQYDARDSRFIQRTTKDSDEIREEFKPSRGVDAIATLVSGKESELRARAQTRMEDIAQKRVENAAPYVHEFEQLQKQLLEAVTEWKSTSDSGSRVLAATRVGALQKQLAEVDEMRSKALYPNMYVAKYAHGAESTRKKMIASAWTSKPAAGGEEAAIAKKSKGAGDAKTDKSGYRLVHAFSSPVERTVALAETN